jgi:hypothetical protein
MPNPLSPAALELYKDMLRCLNSIAYVATYTFHHKPNRRADIVRKVCECAREIKLEFGCGDLCEDKEKGCVPCNAAN